MEIDYSENALNDLTYWKEKGTDAIRLKISKLIASIETTPFTGIGKPEPLRYELSGKWSRRITVKDRIIYSISDNRIKIHSLRGHYGDK